MLKLIISSYKILLKNLYFIILFSLPLIILSILNVYFVSAINSNNWISGFAYLTTIAIPFVASATDISIYRKLFRFNIINPLSSIGAYIRYFLGYYGISLVGTAPMFLINSISIKLGLSPLSSICIATIGNAFIGFAFMARFYVILPLIIQNKLPSLKEFMLYTKQSYLKWVLVATLVYLPFVVIHYATITHPYLNTILTTIATYLFIGYNICYVNSHRLNKTTIRINDETQVSAPVFETKEEKKDKKKTIKTPKKATKTQTKKTTKPKAATPKKTSKHPTPKLKPVTA